MLLVGGGTGGHITPLLAVAHSIKKQSKSTRIVYIGEKHSKFVDLTRNVSDIDKVYRISAGKFRRYHDESWFKRLFDFKTNAQNVRDCFYTLVGIAQSCRLLGKVRPDIVFIKGSFVGVPVGLACGIMGIPYITHDSDTLPGLANRIISRKAYLHAVGMPKDFYDYPKEKTEYVGIPLSKDYRPVTQGIQKKYRDELNIQHTARVLCVTGGSLGAQRVNDGMEPVVDNLLREFDDLYVLHQTGSSAKSLYTNIPAGLRSRIITKEFVSDLYLYTGAANIVVARAGATTIAELARQGKATVLIPNPLLTGGHQIKNAEHLHDSQAVEILTEEQLHNVTEASDMLAGLLRSTERQKKLGQKLSTFANPDAATTIAAMIERATVHTQKDRTP